MRKMKLVLIAAVAVLLGVSANRGPVDNGRSITFDVTVTSKDGMPVAGLQKANFKVFEDNVEQTLTSLRTRTEPLAVVILAEFSDAYYAADMTRAAEGMVRSLQPEDWISLVSFDDQAEILVDFTHDKAAVVAGLRHFQMPDRHEALLYDALYFVLDRLNRIGGLDEKKSIFVLSTARNTINNRRSYGDVLQKAAASDTAIYTVGLEQHPAVVHYYEHEAGALIRANEAGDTLRAIADATGGLSFFPMFGGQYNAIPQIVNADLRHQYTLEFVSSSTKSSGKLRRLKVEITGTDIDEDNKPDKLRVRHQEGHYGN